MVLPSRMPDLAIPAVSVAEYMFAQLARNGNRIAIIDGSNNDKKFTFAEMRENGMKCGSALYRMGLKKGDMVATCLTNSAEYTFIMMGVMACGAVVTTSNPNYTKEELLHQLKQTEPKIVFANSENYDKVNEVCDQLPSVKALINVEDEPQRQTFSQLLAKGNAKDFPLGVQVRPEDTAMILYSSGTTGLPKGVMLTHRNIVAIFLMTGFAFRLSQLDVVYLVMPMFHIYGVLISLLVTSDGSRLVVKKRFDFVQMLKDIQNYKISRFTAAPPIIVGMDQLPEKHGFDISSLREIGSGAAPLAESVAKSVQKKLNVSIIQGWGLTEGVPGTFHMDHYTPVLSVGSVMPNTFLKIIDTETGKELGPYEDGEILIKGPQIMKGYYKNPEATARTIDHDGWLHTGDIGHYDDHEFIYIVDRLKELIKYKGFQVAPAELEDVLLRHPKIVDVGVIGVPDLEAGELPKAYIVRKDETLTEGEVHQFLKDKIAKYKYLRGGITFIEAIPKSPSGKILRRILKEMEKKTATSKY